MIKSYRNKPKQIKAIKWNGGNFEEVKKFYKNIILAYDNKLIIPILHNNKFVTAKCSCNIGDYLIQDENEFYFCNKNEFEENYEEINCE